MFTRRFWVDAVERATRTGAQAAAALFVGSATVMSVDWEFVGATVGTAVLASLLMSVGVVGVGDRGTASTVRQADE